MNEKTYKPLVIIFAYAAVLYPLWVRSKDMFWTSDANVILQNLFPFFGLAAFSILWLHSISGVFEPWLRRHFNFDAFVHRTSLLVLICLILHPLLLLVSLGFSFTNLFLYYGTTYILLGMIGWLLLITYDIGKALNKYDFFVRNWNKILLISTLGFLLTFFHALGIGHDLQSGPLRVVWIFYGATATLATIWTYGIKRFHIKNTP